MATDLAFDFGRHDLVVAPNKDLDIRTGQATVDQRIRVRLLIPQGEWELDPTNGRLGSHLKDMSRLSPQRSIVEIPLVVRESLQNMTDINVVDVQAVVGDDPRSIDITILYQMVEAGQNDIQADVLATTLTLAG
jgi:hypothetical protein